MINRSRKLSLLLIGILTFSCFPFDRIPITATAPEVIEIDEHEHDKTTMDYLAMTFAIVALTMTFIAYTTSADDPVN